MSDGRIIIDTEIDNSGSEKGIKDLRAKAATLAAEYRKLGMSQSEAFTKAWSEIERESGFGSQKVVSDLKQIKEKGVKILMTSLVALGSMLTTIGGVALKVGIDFESAFTGVRKTVDATEEQFAQLEKSIRDMSKSMPESASQIAQVAEAAGQLGIKMENIEAFTKSMVMLGDSTNMTSDEAATALARLANITGMPQTQFDKLGSVIVALGNNFATTESEITAMGLRLAGAGHQVGMSEAQIMSFSAALSSVGIEAEMGGSAFSKVMVQMQLAAEKGGESLDNFAKVAGMSSEEFRQAFKDDAAGAISSFLVGLSKCEERGTSAIAVLDNMGITEVRTRDALLRAAGASDVFTDALQLGNEAWEENTALANEANTRYDTTESKLKILKNNLVDLGITVFQKFKEPFREALDTVLENVTKLGESLNGGELGASVDRLAIAFGNFVKSASTVISNVLPILISGFAWIMENGGLIASIIAGIGAAMLTMNVANMIMSVVNKFREAKAAEEGLTVAQWLLNAAMNANPIGIIISLIVGLVAAIVVLWNTSDGFRSFFIGLWDKVKEALNGVINFVKSNWQGLLLTLANPFVGAYKLIYDNCQGFRNIVNNVFSSIVNLAKNFVSNLLKPFITFKNNCVTLMQNGKWAQLGLYVVQGIAKGIASGALLPVKLIANLANSIVNAFRSRMKIHSPSRVMEENGEYVGQGVAKGISNSTKDVKNATQEMADAIEEELNNNKSKFEKFCDGLTTALKNQYEQQKENQLNALKTNIKNEEDASKERIKVYESEYNEKLKKIESETETRTNSINNQIKEIEKVRDARVDALQAEIDAIDKVSEEEERAEKRRDSTNKINVLKTKMANTKSEAEKRALALQIKNAESDMNKQENEWSNDDKKADLKSEIEAIKEKADLEKEALKAQIDSIKEESDLKKEKLKEDYEAQKENENNKLETIKEANSAKQEEIESQYEKLLDTDNINAEARKLIMSNNQEEILRLLKRYNPKWQDAGQSLAESLINGLNSEKQSMQDAIAESIDLDDVIRDQQAELTRLKELLDSLNSSEAGGSSGGGAGADDSGGLGDLGEMPDDIEGLNEDLDSLNENLDECGETTNGLFGGIEEKVGGLSRLFTGFAPEIVNFFSECLDSIGSFFGNLWNNISTTCTEGWNNVVAFFTESIPAWIASVGEWFNQLPYNIGFALGEAFGSVLQWGTNTWNYFTTNIPIWINNISTWFSQLPGKVQVWLTNTINNIRQWGTDTLSYITTNVPIWINNIGTFFSQLPNKIQIWLVNALTNIKTWCTNMITEGKKGANDTVTAIVNGFKNIPSKMAEIGRNIVQGIKDGIKSAWNGMTGWIGSLCDGFIDGVKSKFDIHSPSRVMRDLIGKNIVKGIGVGIEYEMPNLQENFNTDIDELVSKLKGSVDYETAKTTASIATNANHAAGGTNSTDDHSTNNTYDALLKVEHMEVRSDEDIDQLARELAFHVKK